MRAALCGDVCTMLSRLIQFYIPGQINAVAAGNTYLLMLAVIMFGNVGCDEGDW